MKKTMGILLVMAIILALPLSALATTSDVTVNGHIGTAGDPSVGPDGTYDITYTTAVHWWVTQDDPGVVKNGDANGPDATVVNKIQNNNSATEIKVSLNSFNLMAGDAKNTTMQGYLNLKLTGNLANDSIGSKNLNTGYTGPTTYTALLKGGVSNAWTFGFDGTYSAPTLTTSYEPEYTMTLGFSFS